MSFIGVFRRFDYPLKNEFFDQFFFHLGVFDHEESESVKKNMWWPSEKGSKINFSKKKWPNFSNFKKLTYGCKTMELTEYKYFLNFENW